MLDGYGLHDMTWEASDDAFGGHLVASPADAEGRGIRLRVRQGGADADLTGARVYLAWRHRATGERGCEPFSAMDAKAGLFSVWYPAALQGTEGTVDAQVMVSWDDRAVSTMPFQIHVVPVLVGGGEHQDGFTLFLDAIKKYEDGAALSTAAADAANSAAKSADEAAGAARTAASDLLAAAARGDFDGKDGTDGRDGSDGKDGSDGVSPSASVAQVGTAAVLTVTSASSTSSADLVGPQGPTGTT